MIIFEETKVWSIFLVRVPPLVKKSKKKTFSGYVQITYQTIDLVELSKNKVFLGIFDEYLGDL